MPHDMVEIDGYDLSNRAYNRLRQGGYTTAAQVHAAPDADLLDIRGFGVGCLAEVRTKFGRQFEHVYLSTACLHAQADGRSELHDYCNAMVGSQGEKRPATCKFCDARCVCDCHTTEVAT